MLFLLVSTGIINTMLMSVYERVREIGTMISLGVRRRQVTALFLLEAGLLGFLGALFGTGLGYALVCAIGRKGFKGHMAGADTIIMYPRVSLAFVCAVLAFAVLGTVLSGLYPAWKAATGSTAGQMADCSAKGDRAAYMELHVAHWRKRIMCAFNRDGACSIYPARPLTCRNAHAVETSALCSGANDGTRPAQRLEFAPLDDYLSSANKALRAAHYALGEQRNRPAALCEAVYGQLQALLAAAKKRGRRSE